MMKYIITYVMCDIKSGEPSKVMICVTIDCITYACLCW